MLILVKQIGLHIESVVPILIMYEAKSTTTVSTHWVYHASFILNLLWLYRYNCASYFEKREKALLLTYVCWYNYMMDVFEIWLILVCDNCTNICYEWHEYTFCRHVKLLVFFFVEYCELFGHRISSCVPVCIQGCLTIKKKHAFMTRMNDFYDPNRGQSQHKSMADPGSFIG